MNSYENSSANPAILLIERPRKRVKNPIRKLIRVANDCSYLCIGEYRATFSLIHLWCQAFAVALLFAPPFPPSSAGATRFHELGGRCFLREACNPSKK